MKFNIDFYNVLITSFGFLALFTAFQTASVTSPNVLEAANGTAGAHGVGYISFSILYATFAIFTWISPVIVLSFGPRYSMFGGAVCYACYMATYMEPREWSIYLFSIVCGIGAAILWTAQGQFIAMCSNESNVNKHFSMFWGIFQSCQIIGGLYAFLLLRTSPNITRVIRLALYGGLVAASVVGSLLFLALRPRKPKSQTSETINSLSTVSRPGFNELLAAAWRTFCRSFTLICSNPLPFILVPGAFVGVNLTFFSSLFATCVGHTAAFGSSATSYIGLAGLFTGIGEVAGSFCMQTKRWLRPTWIVLIFGFTSAAGAAFIFVTMLPNDSSLVNSAKATIFTPKIEACMFAAFLLGLVDSVWQTQISVLLGSLYSSNEEDLSVAFGLFRSVQALQSTITFAYSTRLLLQWQVLIYGIWAVLGIVCFFYADLTHRRRKALAPPALDNGCNSDCCSNCKDGKCECGSNCQCQCCK